MKTQMRAIVLIEEDAVTLELYQRELCKSFKVFAFTELKGVLEVLANEDIQAIVIEPEINTGKGWELIHSIYRAYPDHSIPVIVCSTRDNSKSDFDRDVAKYLTKPVLPGTLREQTLEIIYDQDESKRSS